MSWFMLYTDAPKGSITEREIEEIRGLRVVQAVISRAEAAYVVTDGRWTLPTESIYWRLFSYSKIQSGSTYLYIFLYFMNIPYMHLNSCCGARCWWYRGISFNMLRPRQNDRYFIDDIFKRIFLNRIVRNSITISLKLVPKGPINNIPALVKVLIISGYLF